METRCCTGRLRCIHYWEFCDLNQIPLFRHFGIDLNCDFYYDINDTILICPDILLFTIGHSFGPKPQRQETPRRTLHNTLSIFYKGHRENETSTVPNFFPISD